MLTGNHNLMLSSALDTSLTLLSDFFKFFGLLMLASPEVQSCLSSSHLAGSAWCRVSFYPYLRSLYTSWRDGTTSCLHLLLSTWPHWPHIESFILSENFFAYTLFLNHGSDSWPVSWGLHQSPSRLHAFRLSNFLDRILELPCFLL